LTPDADRDHRDHFHLSVYAHREKRTRKYRTTLIEYQVFSYPWVKRLPKLGNPSSKRVWQVVRQRRASNRRVIRKKHHRKK
ncbi:extensin family protein, partial [Myxococcota bacterium]|nr:extensin family protein [Myxococcota bacterium]